MPERCDHGENLTGILCIDLIAKALILRVYKVLTNDNGKQPEEYAGIAGKMTPAAIPRAPSIESFGIVAARREQA